MKLQTWKLTRIALLSAIAFMLFQLEIPVVAFYKLDFSTFPAILAGFSMGPLAGVAVVAIKDLLHLLQTSTGGVGELADFLMSAAFVVPASIIYAHNRTLKGALIGLAVGIVSIIIVGVLTNYFVLIPFYQNFMPIDAIIGAGKAIFPRINSLLDLVLTVTALFNLIKGVALSLVTFLSYKRLSPLLHNRRA